MSHDHPPVLPGDGGASVPLVGVLNEGVALVDGAAHDLAVLGEDGLDIRLGDQQGVEVPDEDPGVEGALVGLVGDVAAGHQAGGGGRATATNTQTSRFRGRPPKRRGAERCREKKSARLQEGRSKKLEVII